MTQISNGKHFDVSILVAVHLGDCKLIIPKVANSLKKISKTNELLYLFGHPCLSMLQIDPFKWKYLSNQFEVWKIFPNLELSIGDLRTKVKLKIKL